MKRYLLLMVFFAVSFASVRLIKASCQQSGRDFFYSSSAWVSDVNCNAYCMKQISGEETIPADHDYTGGNGPYTYNSSSSVCSCTC